MKNEISAGGRVVKKKSHPWQLLLIKDMNGNWTFPKGLIEKGESPVAAAKREIQEETGLTDLSLVNPLKPISYFYQKDGLIHKTVHYFLFETKEKDKLLSQKEEGISEAKWCSFDQAEKIIGYSKTNKPLLEEARNYLMA